MLILSIDTSAPAGSVALLRGGGPELHTIEMADLPGGRASEQLLPDVAAMLERHNLSRNSVELLVIASGLIAVTHGRVSFVWTLGYTLLNDLGFANILPVGLALFSRSAPRRLEGLCIGIYYLHLFIGGAPNSVAVGGSAIDVSRRAPLKPEKHRKKRRAGHSAERCSCGSVGAFFSSIFSFTSCSLGPRQWSV